MTDLTNNLRNDGRVLVMGIGNYVLQDEGFGVHVVRLLAERGVPDGIDLLDGGTAGLHLMGNLEAYDRVVVIDASLDGCPVGTVRRLRPRYGEFPPLVTAHEIGLKDTLEALQLTGGCPDVEMIVCSVEHYTSLGTELSPAVKDAVGPAGEMAVEAALHPLS